MLCGFFFFFFSFFFTTTTVTAPVQLPEPAVLASEQGVGAVVLRQHAVVEHGHLVEVDDGLELVRDGDDGVLGEFLADDALDESVGCVVDAVGCVSVGGNEWGEVRGRGEWWKGTGTGTGTYLLVASSRMRIELGRKRACARQKSCF